MSRWVDLHALWKIVALGLICGAGLPAVFAGGLKALSLGSHEDPSGPGSGAPIVTRNPVGVALAAVCFVVVLAAIAWGIYFIVDGT